MEASSQLHSPTILPPCPLNSRLSGPWSQSGRFGEEINTLSQISSPCWDMTPESPSPWPSYNTGYTIPATNYINQRKKIGNCTMDNNVLTWVLKEYKELQQSLYCVGLSIKDSKWCKYTEPIPRYAQRCKTNSSLIFARVRSKNIYCCKIAWNWVLIDSKHTLQ
jgi:hypothetical protein